MAKDFRADRIRTGALIGSASGGRPGVLIYSGNFAGNYDGGLSDSSMLDAVGRDVGIFVSGTMGRQDSNGEWQPLGNADYQPGVFLVGGDFHVSGTIRAEHIVAELDPTSTGSLYLSGALYVGKGATINTWVGGDEAHDFKVMGPGTNHPYDTIIFGDAGSGKVSIGGSTHNEMTPRGTLELGSGSTGNSNLVIHSSAAKSSSIEFWHSTHYSQGAKIVQSGSGGSADLHIVNDASRDAIILSTKTGGGEVIEQMRVGTTNPGINAPRALFGGKLGPLQGEPALSSSILQVNAGDASGGHGISVFTKETTETIAALYLSASGGAIGIKSEGKAPGYFNQTVSSGYGLKAYRNISEGGSSALVHFHDDNASNTQATLKVQQDGSGNIIEAWDATSTIFVVADGGGVGIGTAYPSATLEVGGGSGAQSIHIDAGAGQSGSLGFSKAGGATGAQISFDSSENLVLSTVNTPGLNKDIVFKVNDGGVDTEVFRVDGSEGTVAIGATSNIVAKLLVKAGSTDDDAGIKIDQDDSGERALWIDSEGQAAYITCKEGIEVSVDVAGGYGFKTYRNQGDTDTSDPLVFIRDQDGDQAALKVIQESADSDAYAIEIGNIGGVKAVISGSGQASFGNSDTAFDAMLLVKGINRGDGIVLKDASSSDTVVKIYESDDDGVIDVYANNSVMARIHGNGTSFVPNPFGVGVTTPEAELEVKNTESGEDATVMITARADRSGSIAFRKTGTASTAAAIVLDSDEHINLINSGSSKNIILETSSGLIVASGSLMAPSGLSGSLTHLSDGTPYLRPGNNVTIDSGSGEHITITAADGGDTTAQYLVLSATSSLDNERVFTAGTGVAVTDGGAGGAYTVGLDYAGADSFILAATNGTGITVDASNDKLVLYDNDAATVKYVNSNQIGHDAGDGLDLSDTELSLDLKSGGGLEIDSTELAIDNSVVATVSGSTFTGATKHTAGLSGSLTKLTDGTSYLIAGSNISIATGSSGAVTVSSEADITGVTAGTGLSGGGTTGAVTLNIDNSVVATISGSTFTGATKHTAGLSGSLTHLSDGTSYLIAGNNITISTGSSGAVTVASAADITAVNAGSGLTGGATSGAATLNVGSGTGITVNSNDVAINNSVVATISGSTFTGATKHTAGLSGSLTHLSDGTPYLRPGNNITIESGSADYITITAADGGDTSASYLVLSATSSLDNERVLTAGTGIITSDAGAGGAYTVSLDYAGADSFILAATNGTGITVDSSNDKLALYDNDAAEVKYVNANQVGNTYTAGDGLDLSALEFSVDLKSGGGLKIDTTELAVEPANFAGTGLEDDGSDNLRIKNSVVATLSGSIFSGKVGIHTGSNDSWTPDAQLEVRSVTAGLDAGIIITAPTDASGSLMFRQGGTGATKAALVYDPDESLVLVNSSSNDDIIFKYNDAGTRRQIQIDASENQIIMPVGTGTSGGGLSWGSGLASVTSNNAAGSRLAIESTAGDSQCMQVTAAGLMAIKAQASAGSTSGEITILAGDKTTIKTTDNTGTTRDGHLVIQGGAAVMEVVVNEGSRDDIDFRVETDGSDKAIYVDADGGLAGTGEVHIGGSGGAGWNGDFNVHSTSRSRTLFVDGQASKIGILLQDGTTSRPQAELQIGAGLDNVPMTVLINVDGDSSGSYAISQEGGGTKAAFVLDKDDSVTLVNSGSSSSLNLKATSTSYITLGDGNNDSPGVDVNVFISGSKSTANGNSRGTALFGGDVSISGSIHIANNLVHQGDTDTRIGFETNKIKFIAAGDNMFAVDATDGLITINADEAAYTTVIKTANKLAIGVLNSRDQVLILSGGGSTSFNEGAADDVNFYISGSVGSRSTSDRGTSVFGGDVHISGSITSDNTTFGQWTDGGSFIHPADSSGAETVIIGANTTGAANIVLGSDGATQFNKQNAAVDFRVRSENKSYTLFVDGDKDAVTLGRQNLFGDDAFLNVSGSILSRGVTSDRGLAVFGGDTYVSGALLLNKLGTTPVQGNIGSDNVGLYAKDDSGTTKLFYMDDAGTEIQVGSGGGGGGPGDANATFLLVSATGSLNAERVLAAGAGISTTDGGAGNSFTVAMDYAGADSFILAATDGTGITVDGDNDKLVLYDNDTATVKYVTAGQVGKNFTAGTGLSLSSTTFSIDNSATATLSGSQFSGNVGITGSFGVTSDALFKGSVTLGNATGDDLTFTGYAASNIIPKTDNTYDLGSSGNRWANVYTGDLHLRNDKGNWTIQEDADMLIVINNLTGKKYKMMLEPLEENE